MEFVEGVARRGVGKELVLLIDWLPTQKSSAIGAGIYLDDLRSQFIDSPYLFDICVFRDVQLAKHAAIDFLFLPCAVR
jgi:hypothetical protein